MTRREWLILLLAAAVALVVALVALRGPAVRVEPHGITNFDSVQVDSYLVPGKVAAVTVTAGSTIAATGTYQPITAAAAVATSAVTAVAAGTTVGQLVFLLNTSVNAITVKNAAKTVLPGALDLVLGQNDGLLLIWDGTNWIAVSSVNN